MRGFWALGARASAALSLLCDLIVINFFVLLSFLGIVTGGAGVAAGYAVIFRRAAGADFDLAGAFWRLARRALPKTFIPWLIFLFFGVACFGALHLFSHVHGGVAVAARAVVVVLFLATAAVATWFLALVGYGLSASAARRRARSAVVGHPQHTILALAVVAVPAALAAISLPVAARLAGFYVVAGIAATLYLQAIALAPALRGEKKAAISHPADRR